MRKRFAIPAAALLLTGLTACQTRSAYTGEQKTSSSTTGSILGAVGGAVLGNQVKGSKTKRRNARVAGAVLGGVLGGYIGDNMDKQEEALRQELASTGVSVTRQGDQIVLNMPGNITFASGRSSVTANARRVLTSVAKVANKYDDTQLEVIGHTDSRGSQTTNQTLSQQRANAVATVLRQKGVSGQRINVVGLGETQPVATNATAAGRATNRRVEITLAPVGTTQHTH